MEGLQDLVRREHLDVGFAFDGDADRCLCVDEKGEVITVTIFSISMDVI
ncbi:MAG: hypothetical protein ACLS9K_01275 [Lachnospira eligens]